MLESLNIESPLVSIITVTYNRAHLVEQSLRSIKNQSFKDWECIVIDDHSTDSTPRVVKSFIKEDERFKYYTRTVNYNKGLSGCRNQGLDLASGDYIIFFDDDDLVHPKNLEINLSYLLKLKKDFCNYQKKPFSEQEPEMGDEAKWNGFREFNSDHLEDFIMGERAMASCTVMWSKKCFKEIRFCEDLYYAEEWESYARILMTGYDGITIEDVLYFNRKHSRSNTGRFNSGDARAKKSMSLAARLMISNLAGYNYLTPTLEKYFIRLAFKLKDYSLIEELFKYIRPNYFRRFKYKGGFLFYPVLRPLFKFKAKFI